MSDLDVKSFLKEMGDEICKDCPLYKKWVHSKELTKK